jgi:hypothetical protein
MLLHIDLHGEMIMNPFSVPFFRYNMACGKCGTKKDVKKDDKKGAKKGSKPEAPKKK